MASSRVLYTATINTIVSALQIAKPGQQVPLAHTNETAKLWREIIAPPLPLKQRLTQKSGTNVGFNLHLWAVLV
ncbi:MAG: hypothetical protein OFPI_02210 [Osedax symbiont Rs2]|nr:MAG: hypothetical protein OFPI_02210 [Osedax symbiont Rs2]